MSISDENESQKLPKERPILLDYIHDLKPYHLPRPGGNSSQNSRQKSPSSTDHSHDSSYSGSTLYMGSSRTPYNGPPGTPANSPKLRIGSRRQHRGSRRSLSTISNNSITQLASSLPASPEHRPSPAQSILSSSSFGNLSTAVPPSPVKETTFARRTPTPPYEKQAWRVINREILEWQTVCHSGRPSWWSFTKYPRRVLSNRPGTPASGATDWVNETEEIYYPGLCFELARKLATFSTFEDSYSTLHELAFLVAVQMLSASFTLPVDLFANFKPSLTTGYDAPAPPNMPNPHMISSLRMHTNYRWAPAFGYEPRTTSPESNVSNGHDAPSRTPALDYAKTPDLDDSGRARSPRRRRLHRARHVTPASTTDREEWDEIYDTMTVSKGETPPTPTQDRLQVAQDFRANPRPLRPPPRTAQSAPPTPFRPSKRLPGPQVLARQIRNEYPFPLAEEGSRAPGGNYLHQSATLRLEPHTVFVQPVRELASKRWKTLRRRFGHSMSHGYSDPVYNPQATFLQDWRGGTGSPSSPPISERAVRRRRDARSRHDIHSSSMESSPRYNTPTSGTPSGASSPACDPPDNTPTLPEGNVDDLLATARAITNSSASLLPDQQTASHPFLVFTPSNSPNTEVASTGGAILPRNEAGFFIAQPAGSPSFQSRRRSSRRSRSMLSEVYPPEEKAKQITDNLAARRHLQEAGGSILTTPTEESEGSEGSLKTSSSRRRMMMTDSDRPLALSKLNDLYVKPTVTPTSSPSRTTILSSSTYNISPMVIDDDPFSYLVPRRGSIPSRSRSWSASFGLVESPLHFGDDDHTGDAYDPHQVDCNNNIYALRRGTVLIGPATLHLAVLSTEPLLPTRRLQRPLRTHSMPDVRPGQTGDDPRINLGRERFGRIQRVSTNGTTVFTPSEHGLEVDGLPVGPGVEMWDEMVGDLRGRGRRAGGQLGRGVRMGRRRARSFL